MVYIIIDSENPTYQYRLHKPTLERLSQRLVAMLSKPRSEPDEVLKVANTQARFRLVLNFCPKLGDWTLRKSVCMPPQFSFPFLMILLLRLCAAMVSSQFSTNSYRLSLRSNNLRQR
jgi:hypothetical protein